MHTCIPYVLHIGVAPVGGGGSQAERREETSKILFEADVHMGMGWHGEPRVESW